MAENKDMKLYALRYAKKGNPVCFDGVSSSSVNIVN